MANIKNLQPVRTEKEARERGRAGGIASGKARREKRSMKEWAHILGEQGIQVRMPDGRTEEMDMAGAVILGQFQAAINKGNTKAAKFLAELRDELVEHIDHQGNGVVIVVDNKDQADKIRNLKELDV